MEEKALVVREQTAVTWSEEEIQLIRDTVAKGATPQEFKLFLYRCRNMQLDPLKPGQIHFVKYGNSPGTMIVGIEGFRVRASRTGKHAGTKRGVTRDEKGRCNGAWAEVYRTDWTQPAREEVSLAEYNTGKAQWAKMPETMIKKVAEASALRMAFPDELGGVYTKEEMDQAEPESHEPRQAPAITADEWKAALALAKENGHSALDVGNWIAESFGVEKGSQLSRAQYEAVRAHFSMKRELTPEEEAAERMEAQG